MPTWPFFFKSLEMITDIYLMCLLYNSDLFKKIFKIQTFQICLCGKVCFSCVAQIVRHGGALGLGLAALGTARQDVYDLLKSNLYQDDAVTGTESHL